MPLQENEIKDINIRYHDRAAADYDFKWGIDFHDIGSSQVLGKVRKALGECPKRFPRALEIGAGTGYFSLNLARAGFFEEVTATDISPGMIETLERNAANLDIDVRTYVCDAESLPFGDSSFDLIFGHAVLHHIPDLDKAFSEFERVLAPGGTLVFCGEPSASGDRLAAVPKNVGKLLGPLWRSLLSASKRKIKIDSIGTSEHESVKLESQVDVHAFDPDSLRDMAINSGLDRVRVNGEELLANIVGWLARTLEASAEPSTVPDRWRRFAFKSYITSQRVDRIALEPFLPARLFYNLLISARKPKGRL